jgi:hypothetical protein
LVEVPRKDTGSWTRPSLSRVLLIGPVVGLYRPQNSREAEARPRAPGRKYTVRKKPAPGRDFWTSRARRRASPRRTTVTSRV